MGTELPAQGGDAVSEDGAHGGFDQLAAEESDLDAELGEDVTLDDEEAAA
jgi:hypothetical protein